MRFCTVLPEIAFFYISQTIKQKISWDTRQKTAIGQDFSDTKCPIIPAVSMIGENA